MKAETGVSPVIAVWRLRSDDGCQKLLTLLTKGETTMKFVVKAVGAVLKVIAGEVWFMLDPKGYCLSHYTKKELEEMGIDFERH